jgi:hypothetical protein
MTAAVPVDQMAAAVAQRECGIANILLRGQDHFSRSEASTPPTRRANKTPHVKPRFRYGFQTRLFR